MTIPLTNIGCPPAVLELILYLKSQGIAAYPVGGCVRDALLGIPPHDWDLAVEAHPQTVMDVCHAQGYSVIPTGLQHGTVTVVTKAGHVECTACRSEAGYTDGRHPDAVTFTYQLADDLSRRDFTVNAMAAELQDNRDFGLVDLFGGRQDLEKRIIRCVGDPQKRFAEDALRLLRGVRFCVKLGFDMDEETYDALVATKEGLTCVSRERVAEELRKILCSPHPSEGISLLTKSQLLPYVFSSGISPCGIGELEKLRADFTLRCGCLMWQVPDEILAPMLRDLKLSNAEIHAIRTYANPTLPQGQDRASARRLRHLYGERAQDVLRVWQCRGGEVDELMANVELSEALGECVQIKSLAVDGRVLLSEGFPQGAVLGEILAHLLEVVLEDPAKNQREILIEAARSWLSSQ